MNEGPGNRLLIRGRNLRPFMRVSMSDIQARDFLIGSPNGAEANLPNVPPGTYDLVLYDYQQEVSRLKGVITVVPQSPVPTLQMEVGGAFVGINQDMAGRLTTGQKLPDAEGGDPVAEVVSIDGPLRPALMRMQTGDINVTVPVPKTMELPATLRVSCFTSPNPDGGLRCLIPGPRQATVVMPEAQVVLRAFGSWLPFQITEVHVDPKPPTADARVRLVVTRPVAAAIRAGDVESRPLGYAAAFRARILSAGTVAKAGPELAAAYALSADDASWVDVVMRVPVQRGSGGWAYVQKPFKAGAPIEFQTEKYLARGTIVDVVSPPAQK
jgi:hypothetical protein